MGKMKMRVILYFGLEFDSVSIFFFLALGNACGTHLVNADEKINVFNSKSRGRKTDQNFPV